MAGNDAVWPQVFAAPKGPLATDDYLSDHSISKLVEFFDAKGLAALKQEDRREEWYEDWIAYQAEHRLYASVLSPKHISSMGFEFDLLKLARFLEVFGYFSPAHGYSLQVSFLGLFAILKGTNQPLKQEAVAALEAGRLFALGASEREHGSDLLGNEFAVTRKSAGGFVANGSKYYIGNANRAAMISVLAREQEPGSGDSARRPRFVLFALRQSRPRALRSGRKIHTMGIRSAYVGEFEVKDYDLPQCDVIAEGRDAWEAILGTVTLGKFFLGFGSIGICEHALAESAIHVTRRKLYGKRVIDMPHIRMAIAQAYARLTAMKLYAYRALDYVHAASDLDHRYLLFCAVQKAKVSTEGVRVMALISECMGARGFESETYVEMALRDAQLIPALEGSAHLNLRLAAQCIPQYFNGCREDLTAPKSLIAGEAAAGENPYLMEARSGNINKIAFGPLLRAYEPLLGIPNVRLLARQVRVFQLVVSHPSVKGAPADDIAVAIALGQCIATIAYAQLIAENALRLDMPPGMISVIFGLLIGDFSESALQLGSLACMNGIDRLVRRMVTLPRTSRADWDSVSARVVASAGDRAGK